MVAIVSGNSLGINLSSLAKLGDQGVFGNANLGRSNDQVYINAWSGNLVFRTPDDQLAGHGSLFGSVRTYNSQGKLGHADAWSIGAALKKVRLNGQLFNSMSTMTRIDDDGSEQSFLTDPSIAVTYVSSGGVGAYDKITYDSVKGQFVWQDGSTGLIERYEGSGAGRLLSSTDASGNTRTYAYGPNGKLSSVTDASGGVTYYDYVGQNLTQIRTATVENGVQVMQTRVRYGYDGLGRLSAVSIDLTPEDGSIADGKVFQTFYTYDGDSDRLASVSQTDGTQLSFTYVQDGADFRVSSVTDALGQVTRYTYSYGLTTVVNPKGEATLFQHNYWTGQLRTVTTPPVNGVSQVTTFTMDGKGNVTRIDQTGGYSVTMTYDSRGNQLSWSDSGRNVVNRTYDSGNRVLTEISYVVPMTQTGGAARGELTTRYVYDAAGRLRFHINPVGNVTEYRYNAYGERVSTLSYAGDVFPIRTLAINESATLTRMESWAATVNFSRVSRVDSVYDYRGLLQQTIAYQSVSSSGDGILDGEQVLTRYVYDQAGRLLTSISPTNGATSYVYDGLGRQISVQDAQGNLTLTQYDDAGGQVVVKQAGGLNVVSTYDKAGRLVTRMSRDQAGANLGETRYAYDANDRLIMTTDPSGGRQFNIYDAAGRKAGEIDASGALIQYIYNDAGKLWRTTRYFGKVNLALLVDAQGKALTPSIESILPNTGGSATSWNLYDTSGRLAKTIGETNAITEYVYDGLGRMTEEIKYAQRMTTWKVAQPSRPEHAVVSIDASDVHLTRYYNADGTLRGVMDGEGGVIEYVYDGAGREVQRISYANKSSRSGTNAQFESIKPASSPADITDYKIYNNLGRLVGTIDGEGYLTELVYDASGNPTTKIRYATSLTGANNPSRSTLIFTPDLAKMRPASTPQDQVWTYSYTRLDKVSSERNAEGTLTLYVYDEMGRLTSTVKAAGTATSRSVLSRYDVQGRLIGELSGEGAAKLDGNQTQAEIDAIWKTYGTTYTYDALGRRTSMMDGAGQRTLYYFDASGRVTHTINALGYVQERVYDNIGQLVETIRYGAPIALQGLNGGLVNDALRLAIAATSNADVDIHATYTYTADGRVAKETDGAGGVIERSYDAFGNEIMRLTKIAGAITRTDRRNYDRMGRLTQTNEDAGQWGRKNNFEYDAFGRLITNRDGNGASFNHVYDKLGREVATYDVVGSKQTAYDAFGNVLWRIDELGRRTSYTYDALNRSATVTTPDGVSVTTVHNAFGQTVEVRDGNGNVTHHTYNADGSLVRTEAGGRVVTQAYDSLNRLVETVDGRGIKTVYTYDAVGQRLSRTVDPGGLNQLTEYRYDGLGRQYQTTEPGGARTVVTFDKAGRVLSSTVDADGLKLVTRYTYNEAGQRLTVTAPNGVVTVYTYDSLGRRDSETVDPSGLALKTTYGYDMNDNLVSKVEPGGAKTLYAYDSRGRVTFKVDAGGYVLETRYDAANQVLGTIAYATPLDRASLTFAPSDFQMRGLVKPNAADLAEYRYYDSAGRLAMTVSGTGNVVAMRYDGNGNLIERTAYATRLPAASVGAAQMPALPMASPIYDQRQRTVYDALNRAVFQIDGLGGVVRQRYDANGNVVERVAYSGRIPVDTAMSEAAIDTALAAVADATRDQRAVNVYDSLGRLAYTMNGLGTVTRNTYDASGNLLSQTLFATRLAPGSDPATVPAAPGDITVSRVYDSANRLVGAVDANGNTTRYVLDAAGRTVFQIDPAGAVVETRYDAAGRVVATLGYATPIVLQGLGQQATDAQVRALLKPQAGDQAEYRYYGADARLAMTVSALGAVVTYRYDASGNLAERTAYANRLPAASIGAAAMPAAPAVDMAYDQRQRTVYDALGRAVLQVDGTGAVVRQRYDANGNVVERIAYAARVPANVSLTSAAIEAALATAADAARDLRTLNAYDGIGRLTHVMDGLGAVTENIYDAAGNRVRQIQYATPVTAGGDPRSVQGSMKDRASDWVYDGLGRQVASVDPTGALTRRVLDANGNAIQVISYAVRLGTGVPRTAQAILAALQPGALDRATTTAFDAAGRAVLVIDAERGVQRNTYDAAGNLLESYRYSTPLTGADLAGAAPASLTLAALTARLPAADGQGRSTRSVYGANGLPVYKIDAAGFVTQLTYDTRGNITSSRRYANGVLLGSTPSAADVAAVLSADNARDRVDTFVYDAAGRLLGSTDSLGKSESYGYDGVGNKIRFVNKAGNEWTYEYDAAGRLLVERTPLTSVVDTSWSGAGDLVVGASKSISMVTRNVYDGLGNLISRTEADGQPQAKTTRYVYDAAGRQVRTIFAPVNVYDAAADNLLTNGASGVAARKESAPISLTSDVLYDAFGNAVAGRDVAGAISYKVYDKTGALKYEVDAEGFVTEYERNAQGDVTLRLRYATKTALTSHGYIGITAEAVSAAVNAAGIDHSGDRGVVTQYDRLGRAVESSQSQIYAYDSSAAAGAQYFTSNKLTRTEYDAFGQAVAVRELVNPVSQVWATTTQYYDRVGNMTARVDALGYVTTMSYDGMGNKTSVREYATATNIWNAQGYGLPVTHANDRLTTYAFDALGRKVAETRVNVEYSNQSNGTVQRGDLKTTFGYDALGNQTYVANPNGGRTYSYYDALGRVTATAEPMRTDASGKAYAPLTTFYRDALGNTVLTIQHANGASTVLESGYTPGAASGQDRYNYVGYDSRGNKIQTIDANGARTNFSYNAAGLMAKQWRGVTGNDGSVKTWFQAYEYDKLGHQTRVIDPASTAVLKNGIQTSFSSAPKEFRQREKYVITGDSAINLNWSSLIDAGGGLVRVQVYYSTVNTLYSETTPTESGGGGEGGEGGVSTGGTTITYGSASVATSRTVDFGAAAAASGVSIRWNDYRSRQGGIAELSYIRIWQQDAAGNWISKWEGSNAQANGSGIFDVSQQEAGWSDTVTEYNAFGEVVRRGVNGGRQEYYQYDNAGNVVRTNAKDGKDQITLYNLQGKATANLTSGGAGGGNVNVAAIGSIQQAANMGNLRREDTVYNLLGNAVKTLAPERSVYEGGVTVNRDFTGAAITSSATMYYIPKPETGGGSEIGEGGNEGGTGPVDPGTPAWRGTNSVQLSWTSLANLGDGDVRVVMTYQSAGGTRRSITQNFAAASATSGVLMSWDGAANNTTDGGVSRVVAMVVYKKDTNGTWQAVINQQGTFGNTGNFIDIAAPVDPGLKVRLEIRVPNGGWSEVGLVNYGNSLRYDAEGLAIGNYEYRVSQIGRDGVVKVTGNGTLSLAAPSLASVGSAMGFGSVGNDVFSWPSFGAGVDAQFRYRVPGGGWVQLPVSARASGHDGVDWVNMGAGRFEYELLLIDRSSGAAYAHATGYIDKSAAVPDRWVPQVGYPPISQALTLDTSNTGISWTTSGDWRELEGTATLKYRLQGSNGAWSSVVMNKVPTTVPFGPVGTGGGVSEGGNEGGENGTGFMTYWVKLGTLPAGNYDFDLVYTRPGSSEPYKHRIGVISQGATTPGYYYTRYYNVTVPYQVWVPPVPGTGEGGEGGESGGTPGYWRTEYRTETRSEQVWVAAVTPRPGMSQTTATYVPGYTVPGRPPAYSLSSTTASNPNPISTSVSGYLGVAASWTPVGANGGVQSSRPTVERTYDRWGNVATVTDPRSPYWITRYTYNANNQVTSEVRPSADGAAGAGPSTTLYYDALGNNVATRDGNGNVNGIQYDAGGNRIAELHADGGVYRYGYNAFGEKTTWVDALGNTTSYTYDKLSRLILTSNAAVTSYVMSNGTTLAVTGTKTVTESVRYDELGNKLSSTNGAGDTVYFRYDLRGNVTGVRKPGMSTELRTAYDARGNKTFEADGNGNASTWAYDYFGRLVAHTDIGGAKYAYSYDNARQLLQQTNTRGQNLNYTYDATGLVTRIYDASLGKITDFSYDHAGNKVRERTSQGGVVYQNNIMAYDALGRLREVSDGYLRQSIDYDANGNRKRVQTQYTDASDTWRNRDYWYGYDAMNRQTTVEAVNANLEINAAQGHKLTYDANGNRLSDTYWDKVIYADGGTAAGFTTETYTYDAINRLTTLRRDGLLLDARYYDGADRVVLSGIDGSLGKAFFDRSGLTGEQRRNVYDGAGRLYSARVLKMTAAGLSGGYATTYSGYDQAGNVTQYRMDVYDGSPYTNTYTYTHARYEGYREATLSGTSTELDPGQTTYQYDVNGNLIGVVDTKDSSKNQTLVNDANGKILQRVQNGQTIRSLVVNGELLGTTGPAAGADDFSPAFRPIDGGNPSASPGSYRIQAGDTLQSIAQQAYGDSRLWYLVAEANGLASDRDLRVGATVTIPNRVSGNHNDYKTFKPYDPGKLIGDTQPTMPVPEADSGGGGGGCGGIGKIFVAVVAVVATVFTAGALAPVAAAGFGATMAAGAAVLTGASAVSGLAAVGIGLAAGAVGSIVSQGVGMAIGVQSKFSWKGVATSALGAGATAGVGAAFNGANFLSGNQALVDAAAAGGAATGFTTGSTAVDMALRATVSSTMSQGIAMATGLQSKFSWTNVAAAGIGAGVGSAVGAQVFPNASDFSERLARGFVAGAAGGVAASVLSGGKANYLQIATDAFGNALGNSIVAEATDRATRHLTEEQNQKLKQAYAEWQGEERGGFGRQQVLLAANDDAGGGESDTRSITLEAFNKAKETNAGGVLSFGIDRYSPRFGTTFLADGTDSNPYAQQAAVALGGGFAVLDSSLPAITASGFDGPAGELVRDPLGFATGNLKSLWNNTAGFAGTLLIQSAVGQAQSELEMSGALLRMDVSDVQSRISAGGDYLSELITARPRSGAEGVGMMTGDVTSLMSGINGLAKGAFELYRGYKLPEGIYRDSRGVYGYMPKPGSRYDKAEFDFSNDVFVSRVRETRLGYLNETRELESVVARLRSEGASSEYIANRVVWQRNSQKLESRSTMTESEVRSLEVENMVRYHDPVGPTPQELFRKSRSWEDVISSSMRKDPALNKLLGIDGVHRGW
ncbi:LysM peptidoglycan-binding domain-containing protein [Achromobacter xylosoxidans]|uniref:LysM peptidoglycan-binding domain-containing protein n=1 Tax=Alcaligenes xylosoxydans xylosoxydans TaxID=85698 RepID=UPI0022B8FD6C|nr:LysM peptidoglycan-binding domain-containing protein [Achromobacter xylosoxidans]MCZ8384134.1 LysM peptidoglycan-binding domain-containing protein [Achromobacter xylosoxidans]